MGFSRILAEFAEKFGWPKIRRKKNTASRKSAEKVCQPAEYNKKIRLVGLCIKDIPEIFAYNRGFSGSGY